MRHGNFDLASRPHLKPRAATNQNYQVHQEPFLTPLWTIDTSPFLKDVQTNGGRGFPKMCQRKHGSEGRNRNQSPARRGRYK